MISQQQIIARNEPKKMPTGSISANYLSGTGKSRGELMSKHFIPSRSEEMGFANLFFYYFYILPFFKGLLHNWEQANFQLIFPILNIFYPFSARQ